MPAKNSLKEYLENGYYHIYNRGVEKRKIFLDEQDYGVFLSYLKEYLMPKDEEFLRERLSDPNISYKEREKILKLIRLSNFYGKIDLYCYSLMPNHFHFQVKQKDSDAISDFMASLDTRYTMYFNRKYKRVGCLYQGVYKAVLLSSNEQLLQLSRYIHNQALATKGETLRGYNQPSSIPNYLGKMNTPWIKTDEILNFFNKSKYPFSYEAFIKQNDGFEIIGKIVMNED